MDFPCCFLGPRWLYTRNVGQTGPGKIPTSSSCLILSELTALCSTKRCREGRGRRWRWEFQVLDNVIYPLLPSWEARGHRQVIEAKGRPCLSSGFLSSFVFMPSLAWTGYVFSHEFCTGRLKLWQAVLVTVKCGCFHNATVDFLLDSIFIFFPQVLKI